MNEAFDLLKEAVQKIVDEDYPYNSWEEIEAEGLEYVTSEYIDTYSRWTDYTLHVFRKGADIAGVIVGTGKTERQENDEAYKWEVVEVKATQKTVYEAIR